jgi:hypothetical protein
MGRTVGLSPAWSVASPEGEPREMPAKAACAGGLPRLTGSGRASVTGCRTS